MRFRADSPPSPAEGYSGGGRVGSVPTSLTHQRENRYQERCCARRWSVKLPLLSAGIFRAADVQVLTATPIDAGLPPFEIVFPD
jgi:hypothetical protein